jgi:hypothetical protein
MLSSEVPMDCPGELGTVCRKLAETDFTYRLPATQMHCILLGMWPELNSISRPGWTGKLGALRIVKAAQRTSSSVDPKDRHSAVPCTRGVGSSDWSLKLRVLPPVSVTLRDIETGGANLAQSQNLRALQRSSIDAKVSKPAFSATVSTLMPRPRLIRGRCNIDRPEASGRAREDLLDPSVLLLEINSRVVERNQPGAAGVSSGLILSDCRIDLDRQQGSHSWPRRASPWSS